MDWVAVVESDWVAVVESEEAHRCCPVGSFGLDHSHPAYLVLQSPILLITRARTPTRTRTPTRRNHVDLESEYRFTDSEYRFTDSEYRFTGSVHDLGLRCYRGPGFLGYTKKGWDGLPWSDKLNPNPLKTFNLCHPGRRGKEPRCRYELVQSPT
jgi:hypothetical protein